MDMAFIIIMLYEGKYVFIEVNEISLIKEKETWLSGTQVSASDQSQSDGTTKDQGSNSGKSIQHKEPPALATAG
jgi:hypothetical protein